jgi:hypothetical protein
MVYRVSSQLVRGREFRGRLCRPHSPPSFPPLIEKMLLHQAVCVIDWFPSVTLLEWVAICQLARDMGL